MGCGASKETATAPPPSTAPNPAPAPSPAPAPTPAPTPAPAADPVTLDGFGYVLRQKFKDAASLDKAAKTLLKYKDANKMAGCSSNVSLKIADDEIVALAIYPDSAAWLK
eukprot:SAG31_NODE_15809_length_738_cov_0.588419_1_plen_109_part_10